MLSQDEPPSIEYCNRTLSDGLSATSQSPVVFTTTKPKHKLYKQSICSVKVNSHKLSSCVSAK